MKEERVGGRGRGGEEKGNKMEREIEGGRTEGNRAQRAKRATGR